MTGEEAKEYGIVDRSSHPEVQSIWPERNNQTANDRLLCQIRLASSPDIIRSGASSHSMSMGCLHCIIGARSVTKAGEEVRRLIAGPNQVTICDECRSAHPYRNHRGKADATGVTPVSVATRMFRQELRAAKQLRAGQDRAKKFSQSRSTAIASALTQIRE